jgi:NADPH2:quinone reductase
MSANVVFWGEVLIAKRIGLVSLSVRALVCNELGPLDSLAVEECEPLVAGPGQVVIDVTAAGVNFVDGLTAQGRYQIKPSPPYTPGGEAAGVVAAVGEGVTSVNVGQRVVAMTGYGAFAQQASAPEVMVFALPDDVDDAVAATMLQSYGTAMFTMRRRTHVDPGEWVLVLGAGGGVGLACVDVARALGARVIAAASSAVKLDAAAAVGAEASIAYEDEGVDLKTVAREISGGGVDVVIDIVGGRHSEPALRATRLFGRFCVVGFAAGPIPTVPLNQVLLNNRTVVGVEWGGWAFRNPVENHALLAEVLEMAADGRLHPATPAERPLEDAADVMQGLIDRRISGKVVLRP